VELEAFQAILERAGIQTMVARRICDLVRMTLEGNPDQSPEFTIIAAVLTPEEATGPKAGECHSTGGSPNPR
jgi:hypothetical protein